MKICIIGANKEEYMPYLKFYTKICSDENIEYDYIEWDRNHTKKEIIQNKNKFTISLKDGDNKIIKLLNYIKWKSKVIRILKEKKYEKIIVLTTLSGVMLSNFISRKYECKYIFDIRDYTYDKFRIYRKIVEKVIKKSYLTSISSEGFKSWINNNTSNKIYINHNFPANYEQLIVEKPKSMSTSKKINIAYLGLIYYDEENIKIIEKIKNSDNYNVYYHGKLSKKCKLDKYCKDNKYKNIFFTGEYKEKEKSKLYNNIDIILSAYGSDNLLVSTLLPNKLYDALIYKKPIIVSKNTYLSEIVEKYRLGIVFDEKIDFEKQLMDYIKNFEEESFEKKCNIALKAYIEEVQKIKNEIKIFLKK